MWKTPMAVAECGDFVNYGIGSLSNIPHGPISFTMLDYLGVTCWVLYGYLSGPQDSAGLSILAIFKIGVCFLGNKKVRPRKCGRCDM